MKVSVVIPNYNGKENLIKNLPKILEAGADEIIVVDDASTDDSVESIKYLVSSIQKGERGVKLLENNKNLGFSSTVNRGVKEAIGDIVVLLNTDVLPEKDFLKFLLPHFSDPKVFAVGCMDKSIENGKIVLRGRGLGEWERGFYMHRRGEVDKTDTDWVSCGSGAFKKSLWKKLGGLDKVYNPFYWEDLDLSFRAKKKGYRLVFEPRSIVVHNHEKGAIKTLYTQEQIKRIAYRNQFLFTWKNMDSWRLWLGHFFWLPYYFFRSIKNRDLAFIRGLLNALTKIPVMLKF